MTHRITLLILALCFLNACGGGIPSAYRGKYADPVTGAKLELKSNEGVFESEGKTMTSHADFVDFEKLLKGKAGIYLQEHPTRKKVYIVFWIAPDIASRQEIGGMIFYRSEVLYTRMDSSRQTPVDSLRITHPQNGHLTLDLIEKTWEIGWDPSPQIYDMKRIPEIR